MKALVVYESLYGNTAAIGETIASGLRSTGVEVEVGPISRVVPERAIDVDLLVVGGPTHAHGMTWGRTRDVAMRDEKNAFDAPTGQPGLREWMHGLPAGHDRKAAAFDTRFAKAPAVTGSAARGIARRLEGHGYGLVTPAQSFFVTGENTLEFGQAGRAAAWGAELASAVAGPAARPIPA
jgi:hypothetical protein